MLQIIELHKKEFTFLFWWSLLIIHNVHNYYYITTTTRKQSKLHHHFVLEGLFIIIIIIVLVSCLCTYIYNMYSSNEFDWVGCVLWNHVMYEGYVVVEAQHNLTDINTFSRSCYINTCNFVSLNNALLCCQ